MRLSLLASTALCCAISFSAQAQPSTYGTDYWVSFPPSIDSIAPIWLEISATVPGTRVQLVNSDDNSVEEFRVDPWKPREYRVRLNNRGATAFFMAKPDRPEMVQRRSIQIKASHPISVLQFTDADNNVGLCRPIPTGFLGKTYIASCFNDQHPRTPEGGGIGGWSPAQFPRTGGEFVIVAPFDQTTVSIRTTGDTRGGRKAGEQWTVKLNRGETYWVLGLGDSESNDLSGSLIQADKPIAVVAGAEIMRAYDALVLEYHFDYNDYISEYMLPAEYWGTEYLGTPFTNNRGTTEDNLWGELYRVYALESTELVVNGTSRGRSTYWEFPLVTAPMHFASEKPIMVVQYDYYVDFHGTNPKSPRTSNSMSVLVPRQSWTTSAIATVPTGYQLTYFYITAHKDSLDRINVRFHDSSVSTIAALKFNKAQTYNTGPYRTYTLVLNRKGQYLFSGPAQFQLYNHGTRDNDAIKATYGYASPVSGHFAYVQSTPSLLFTRDSVCNGISYMLTDTSGVGIAEIRHYRSGQNVGPDTTNLVLDIEYQDSVTRNIATVRVRPGMVFKRASGSIEVVMRSGQRSLLPVNIAATEFQVVGDPNFGRIEVGRARCGTIVIRNTGLTPLRIDSFTLLRGTEGISIDHTGELVLPGLSEDTIELCAIATDTGMVHEDSLIVHFDCKHITLAGIRVSGTVGVIYAEDHNFGTTTVGRSSSYPIRITNESTDAELRILSAEWTDEAFYLDTSVFPLTIPPNDRRQVDLEYRPVAPGPDTVIIQLITDRPAPYDTSNRKDWILARGFAEPAMEVVEVEVKTNHVMVSVSGITVQIALTGTAKEVQLIDMLGRIVAQTRLDGHRARLPNVGSAVYLRGIDAAGNTCFVQKLPSLR